MLKVFGEAAFTLHEGAVVFKCKYPRHHPIQKISVMGYANDHARKSIQIVLQHLQRLDVEIVGRFVEDEDIGIFHEHFQQAETALFAAGELADRGVLHFRIEEKALAHR